VDLLQASGWSAYLQADYEPAGQQLEQALGLCRELGDASGEATALNELALTAWAQGRTADARELLDSSLALARQLGDDVKQAARLSNLGLLSIQAGELDQARGYLVEAQAIYDRRQNIHGKAASLCNLADLALRQQQWEEAEALSQQGLEQFRLLDDRYGVALTLANLSEIALHRADHAAAERYLREALVLCVEIGRRGLIPHLLEIRARNQAAIGAAEHVFFSLTAAERLRHEFSTPRCSEEGEAVDPALAELLAGLDERSREAVRAGVAQLTLDGLIAEILKPLSPAARDLAVSPA
jgi:ATP/maltotriose-dependent transcriptional regulator MalT